MVTFCAACDQTEARLDAVGAERGARAAERILPPLPEDCRALSRAGVQEGDRLDVALLKIDRALTRQNMRTTRCAEWFDQLRAGLQSLPSEGVE
ncbi:hypothetical protein [Sulfitobacter sp.]|uniref:hypothetical protein n=1 Tax=Sulfitobacter sp. TaxID=1903071 RepID=UPI003002F0CA